MTEASGLLLGQISGAGAAIAVNMGIRMEWGTSRRRFLWLLAGNHTQAQPQEVREDLKGISQYTQLQQASATAECS
jgi:hypothetical protein